MKRILILLSFLMYAALAGAQDKNAPTSGGVEDLIKKAVNGSTHPAFVKKSFIATLSVGFIDHYRNNYTFPKGFEKNNFSGFAPVYTKLEYAVSKRMSIATMTSYDAFYANYYQLYYGNGNTFRRYRTDKVNIGSYGIGAYYHFMPVKKLDAFAGVGLSVTRMHHTAMPQGDSTAVITDRNVSPSIRAGARYYFADKGSVYADFGYDKQSIFCMGFSARFFKK